MQPDFLVTAGQTQSVAAVLQAATLTSLREIGSVTSVAGRQTFNTSALSVTTLNNANITARVQPNLKDIVSELPGVIASRDAGGRSPNSSFQIRGANIETKVTIDGHAISSGVFGTYNNNYANSQIFDEVEVLKGAGLNGVNAGESAFGTVNLRTRNFRPGNFLQLDASMDTFGSGWLNFLGNYNVGKWSFVAARSFQGYTGPNSFAGNVQVANTVNGIRNSGTNYPGYTGPSLIQWTGDLANPYSTEADLVKARYKFSSATWLTAEWLNLTGRYYNQGGSYAYTYGNYVIPQCLNGSTFVAASAPGCTPASTYNAPWTASLIGTTQPLYSFFPNSTILNNEPSFSAELRTTHKDDTFVFRPYRSMIKRDINGAVENLQVGYGSPAGWYQVTNNLNCQVTFVKPGAGLTGAKGPCFTAANGYSVAYVGASGSNPATPPLFATTSTAPTCTPTAPCWTTPTNQQRNGYYGFNTPFSQPEIDRLSGMTFTWLHPVHDNTYSFSVDFTRDNTLKFTADNSALPAGCFPVVSGGKPNSPRLPGTATANPYYQPNCTVNGTILPNLPATALQIPPTTNYKTDFSLTALWQINPKLQVGLGNYLTVQKLDYVYTDPLAASAAASPSLNYPGCAPSPTCNMSGAEQADATLVHGIANRTHYDPHLQAEYRLNRDVSFRMNAGSSITTPYASLVTGFAKISPNSAGGTQDTASLPNPNLQPETTVAYDLGADARTADGTVVSMDYFNNTIHNVFVQYGYVTGPLPGRPANFTTLITQTLNGPLERDYGVELTVQRTPRFGLGYYGTMTEQRAYYDGFSQAFYQSIAATGNTSFLPLVNGKQLDGTGGFQGTIPYFKSKLEANYRARGNDAYYALGTNILGSNNPFGIPAFNTIYANASWKLAPDMSLTVSGENLLNFGVGTFYGQVVNNAGFWPVGTRWNTLTNSMQMGNYGTFPDSAVVIPPRTVYFTLSKKVGQ